MSKGKPGLGLKPPAAPADAQDETLPLKRRWLGFLPPASDRTQDGFVKAIRAAIEDLGGVAFESAGDMEDAIEEHIRRALSAPAHSITVRFVGRRIANPKARIVVSTVWGLREDVEGALTFQLFKSTK